VVRGLPTQLNRALAEGRIDAAPCSSIEYARHAADYQLLPFTIASRGPVQSILLELASSPQALAGLRVGLPTASATSVVLLRILLERRYGVRPSYVSFDQAVEDPFDTGCAAALFIGDVALRRVPGAGRHVLDLGREWFAWTGLPFAFALWQVRRALGTAERDRLGCLLQDSRAWFLEHRQELADQYAPGFGLDPGRLLRYWDSLVYELTPEIQAGLLRFVQLAAELGEAPLIEFLDVAEALTECKPRARGS